MMSRVPDWMLARPVAHRGLHDAGRNCPENSLAAFEAAAATGYPVELDVQLTADAVPVVYHDTTLDRLTELRGRLDAQELRVVADARLAGTSERIPTFQDVLELIDGRVGIVVEIKSFDGGVGPCEAATLKALRAYRGPFVLQSFNPFSMAWFAHHAPDLVRGQLSGPLERYNLQWSRWRCAQSRLLRCNWLSRPDFICYECGSLPMPEVARARSAGVPVTTYTVKTAAEQKRLAELVDNIIFEGFQPD